MTKFSTTASLLTEMPSTNNAQANTAVEKSIEAVKETPKFKRQGAYLDLTKLNLMDTVPELPSIRARRP